jgi:hypothetical protein
MTEDGRWDYRVTIARDSTVATRGPSGGIDPSNNGPTRRRTGARNSPSFEILLAHWDLPSRTYPSAQVELFPTDV